MHGSAIVDVAMGSTQKNSKSLVNNIAEIRSKPIERSIIFLDVNLFKKVLHKFSDCEKMSCISFIKNSRYYFSPISQRGPCINRTKMR